MISLLGMIKGMRWTIYAGLTTIVMGSVSYFLYSWHFNPLSDYEQLVNKQNQTLTAQEITINNLSVQIVELTENNRVTNFEEYFKGIADANNSTVSDKLLF